MKLTKSQLKQIIKEELEATLEEGDQSISVDLTQEEANLILLALEGLEGRGDPATISSLYDKVLDSGIGSGFGYDDPLETAEREARRGPSGKMTPEEHDEYMALYKERGTTQ